jgi:hypothetical protein
VGLSRAGAIIGGKTARLTREIQRSIGRQVVYVSGESRLRPVWIPDAKIVEQLDDRITELLTELEQRLAKKLD